MMRFAWLVLFVAAVGSALPAHARTGDSTVGATLDVAGPPVPGWGSTLGFTLEGTHEFARNIAAIGSVSFYHWNRSPFDLDIYYERVPIDGGLRFYMPANRQLRFFVQGAVELSIDRVGSSGFPGSRTYASDVRVGVVPGVGLDYRFTRSFSGIMSFKYHVIDDDYYAFNFGGAFHF